MAVNLYQGHGAAIGHQLKIPEKGNVLLQGSFRPHGGGTASVNSLSSEKYWQLTCNRRDGEVKKKN